MVNKSAAQTSNITTQFSQVSAATDACGTANVPIYSFDDNVVGFSGPTFTAINSFVTTGTYVTADILNFKLYETGFSVFNTGNLIATIPASGPGTHTFNGFSYGLGFSGGGTQSYFWITVDLAPAAINNHTIQCSTIVSPMLVITGGINYGTNTAGGLQTISCSAFPIELVSFTGTASGSSNLLKWITASETNNNYFNIERSVDGNSFESIAEIKGAGNSDVTLYYETADEFPNVGINYYRLKQTDFDGHYKYSDLIAVENSGEDFFNFYLFPDPVQDKLNLKFSGQRRDLTMEIIDISGRSMMKKNIDSVNENGIAIFDVSSLTAGIYFINVNSTNKKVHQKFIKQ